LDLKNESERVPSNAVVGGYERGMATYVARVRHEGTWELGKLNAWRKFGYSLNGKEYELSYGEVLVANAGQACSHPILTLASDHTS
jgi:hypothetical protein